MPNGEDIDAIPSAIAEEITGKILSSLRAQTESEQTQEPPPVHRPYRQRRPTVAQKLGIKAPDVAKFLISMISAVVVAYYGMKFAIEKNTASIDNNSKAHQVLEKRTEKSDNARESLDKRVQTVEKTTVRIETMQVQTLEALREIKADVRSQRGNRRTR